MSANIIIIDNYDSFTYNLVHQIASILTIPLRELQVIRNDALQINQILDKQPSHLVISPGPGTPANSKLSIEILNEPTIHNIPVLGVCLGHQVIVQHCGGLINRAERPIHGHSWQITHSQQGIFAGLPQNIKVARYHSLVAQPPLPPCLEIQATSIEGEIMAISHRQRPWWGVQFHPESFMTEYGDQLVRNFFLG
jgi:anthranilate synthase/aminodeoxychorismate synthase-like glutamine amidotransferase